MIGYSRAFEGLYGPKPIEGKSKMNERIKELAEQAGLSHMPSNYPDMADLYKGADYELAKFAELLVKECARAIVNDSRLNDVRSAANGCVRTIKEHFGVEDV